MPALVPGTPLLSRGTRSVQLRALVATAAALSVAVYYSRHVRAKPRLRYGKTALNEVLIARLASLHAPYSPPFWAANGWVQLAVVLARLGRLPRVTPFKRQLLTLSDGGEVALDWLESASAAPNAPVVLIMHTITGTAREYVQLAQLASARGWHSAVCLRRGHLGSPLTAPRANLLGSTADLRVQLDAVAARYPGSPLVGVSLSAGTGLLVRYLGEEQSRSRLSAGVCICPGYNTAPPQNAFERFSASADGHILAAVRKFFLRKQNQALLEGLPGYQDLLSAKTIAQYQAASYALEGFSDVESMHAATNPMAVAAHIAVPLLVINADDDPVCSVANVDDNAHLFDTPHDRILVQTARGSHCAHLEGWLWPSAIPWCDRVAMEYLGEVLALRGHTAREAPPA